MYMERVRLIFFTAILLTAVLIIFLAAYSQWSEKLIPWPCQSWKGQISFIFLLTPLFHLLQAALCLSITRLHCFLMRCLWPFASLFLCFWLQESETGLLISWPAVLFLHTCSLSLPGYRTGSHFHFSVADRRGELLLGQGGRASKLYVPLWLALISSDKDCCWGSRNSYWPSATSSVNTGPPVTCRL